MGGGDTLFASVRIRNSASNDKYLFAHAVNHSYNFLVKHEKKNIAHPDTVRNKKPQRNHLATNINNI